MAIRFQREPDYTPQRGDLVHMNWSPSAGREWGENHWALVISPNLFQARTGFAVVVAVTSKTDRQHPYQVPIQGQKIRGVILPVHFRTIDFNARKCQFTEKCPGHILDEVLDKLAVITTIDANSR
jgi:mRNA interferase MazF